MNNAHMICCTYSQLLCKPRFDQVYQCETQAVVDPEFHGEAGMQLFIKYLMSNKYDSIGREVECLRLLLTSCVLLKLCGAG